MPARRKKAAGKARKLPSSHEITPQLPPRSTTSMTENIAHSHKTTRPPPTRSTRPKKPNPMYQSASSDDEDIEHDENSAENEQPASASSSDSTPPTEPKKKLKKKPAKTRQIRNVFKIDDEKLEESILEWMQLEEHDFLWNSQRTHYRYPDRKKARFAEKEVAINLIHPELKLGDGFLAKWFEGLRDQYTKLHKRKSGDGAPQFTDRQQWILGNLKFFQRLVTHRSHPVKSFKHTLAENAGDLEAMEQAAADQDIDVDDIEHTDKAKTTKDKRASSQKDTDLVHLQKRVKDSDDILDTLRSKISAPLSEVAAFGSYIQATLGMLSKRKFRDARKAINAVMVPFIDNSTESESADDGPPSVSTGLPEMQRSPPRRERKHVRPTTAAFTVSYGACGLGAGTSAGGVMSSSSTTECASGDSRWQPHPSQWRAPPADQQGLDPWHSMNPDFMQTHQTWNTQQQQQHFPHRQHNLNAQYQGWGQQLQPIHSGAPLSGPSSLLSGPPIRQPRPIPSPVQSPASSDIVSQAMSAVNIPLDTSGSLDLSLNASFDDSSFLKKFVSLPVTPQENEKTAGADDADINTLSHTAKYKEQLFFTGEKHYIVSLSVPYFMTLCFVPHVYSLVISDIIL